MASISLYIKVEVCNNTLILDVQQNSTPTPQPKEVYSEPAAPDKGYQGDSDKVVGRGGGGTHSRQGGGNETTPNGREGSGAQTGLAKGEGRDAEEMGDRGAAEVAKREGADGEGSKVGGAANEAGGATKKKGGWKRKPSKDKKQSSARERARRIKHNAHHYDATNAR